MFEENKEEIQKKIKKSIPQYLIDRYAKYRNKNLVVVNNIKGTPFELEERYEVLDSSFFSIKFR